MRHRRPRRAASPLVAALALLAAVATACGGAGAGGGEPAAPAGGAEAARSRGAPPGVAGEVAVFAAASLTEAFTELGRRFEAAHPGASVTFNFAASSALAHQLAEGAPADVFASADEPTMARVVDAGAAGGEPRAFARNRLAVVVAPGNPKGISGLDDLAGPGVTFLMCAAQVPVGAYAAEALARAGVSAQPASYEENTKAVVTKVVLGEADAGIAYTTDVAAAGAAVSGVAIPDDENVVATYPVATVAGAPNEAGAVAFVDFVLGAEGQAVLASFGFAAP